MGNRPTIVHPARFCLKSVMKIADLELKHATDEKSAKLANGTLVYACVKCFGLAEGRNPLFGLCGVVCVFGRGPEHPVQRVCEVFLKTDLISSSNDRGGGEHQRQT
jgi:hypothetical protein